ncbi:c-type cytochrome [Pusillimonas sp. TS35]|uniref:c-type cytochrome n=1 Tax=Paracandidimonas lactea TaxID=2895524 RepID=UPI0013697F7A|nr:cytochrome c [Paracandidimonas lactea]MYN14361.1 c-type cytochrome [Pusillimonas sp. TS35]
MFTITRLGAALAGAVLACTVAQAQSTAAAGGAESPHQYGFGTPVTDADLQQFVSPLPDGRGLPDGSGTVMQGEKVYAAQCLACHGAKLEGGIGDRLIGGRDSLARKEGAGPPVKTVESYWPYSTTLFDYIKRAMPFTTPNSMSNDDVYAVTAYILNEAGIVPADAVMDKTTLPKVEMPNRNGFKPAGR